MVLPLFALWQYLIKPIVDSGWERCVNVRSWVAIHVPLLWGMWWWGRLCGGRGEEIYGNCLYFPLNFAVNLKWLLKKVKSVLKLKKKKKKKRQYLIKPLARAGTPDQAYSHNFTPSESPTIIPDWNWFLGVLCFSGLQPSSPNLPSLSWIKPSLGLLLLLFILSHSV